MTTATMNSTKTPDIYIYGPIIDLAWWNDSVTTPKQIQNKLNTLGNVGQINVHINSPGGSVFAGQAIHNMLKHHTANITVYIDGLAASVASIIAMAGDKIIMPPGAMMMIHNPLTVLCGVYEASKMREIANFLDKTKESIVATYLSRNTNKTKAEMMEIMDRTTWLTAEDAVKMGFADEIESAGEILASLSGNVLNIAGLSFDLTCFDSLPSIENLVPQINNPASEVLIINEPAAINKEENMSDIKTIEELRSKYPDLINELVTQSANTALVQEKERTAALDALNDLKNPAIGEIIEEAKNSGKTAAQIEPVINILKKHIPAETPAPQNKGQEFLIAAISGNKQSGVENVKSDATGEEASEQELVGAINYMVAELNRKVGKDGVK